MQEYRPPRPEYKFPPQRVYYMSAGTVMTPDALTGVVEKMGLQNGGVRTLRGSF